MGSIDNAAIADTVAAVFRSQALAKHRSVSIGQLIAEWIWSLAIRFLGFTASHPAIGLVLRLALGAMLLAVLARVAYGLFVRYAPSSIHRQRLDISRGTDWWRTAQERVSYNDYTGAAHALYLALLTSAAQRGLVLLHESKTTGDYLRELRRKPGTMDLPSFADFTRSYETVIYGIGTCDKTRYTALNALATNLLSAPSTNTRDQSRTHGATS